MKDLAIGIVSGQMDGTRNSAYTYAGQVFTKRKEYKKGWTCRNRPITIKPYPMKIQN